MKRIKAAAIYQTLVFSQKEDCGLSLEQQLNMNREEVKHYRTTLDRNRTRYVITDTKEQPDASIIVHVRKQYNFKAETDEYFN